MNLLGDELGPLYCKVYNITDQGNFEGENIPHLIFTRREAILEETGLTGHELAGRLEEARIKLLEARENRSYPHTDDKVLTSWNALMIAGLAKAAKVFHAPAFLSMAETAIRFLERHLMPDGRVMVRYREGEVKTKGLSMIMLFSSGLILNCMKRVLIRLICRKRKRYVQACWSCSGMNGTEASSLRE